MIHIDELPEERPQELHRVIAKTFDYESVAWVEEHQPPITEAWIYYVWPEMRVIAWYE